MALDLLTVLNALPDHRRSEGRRFCLAGTVFFSIIALLSGAHSYRRMHGFIKQRLDLLNEAFPSVALRKAPAYSGLRKILQGIDGQALEAAFRRHACGLLSQTNAPGGPKRSLAVDGKTLRGSFDAFADKRAIQLLSVFSTADHIILAHLELTEKTNEIPIAQQIFEQIGLKGHVYTLDAMHCQKNL